MYTSRIPSHIPAVYIAKGINVFDFVFEEGIVHPLITVYYNYVIISVMYMSTMLRNNKMCYRIAGVCIAQSMLLLRCTVKLAGTLCFHLIHTCTCVITSYVSRIAACWAQLSLCWYIFFQKPKSKTLIGKSSAYLSKGKYGSAFEVLLPRSKPARTSVESIVRDSMRKEIIALTSTE